MAYGFSKAARYIKSEKYGIAYGISEFNGIPHLDGIPIMKDGSLSDNDFEVDFLNAFTLDEIRGSFRDDMRELFDNDTRIEEIFDRAIADYKWCLSNNMD